MLCCITADISQPSLPNCLPLCLPLTNAAAVFVSEVRGNASHPWWKNWKTPGSTNSSRAEKWTRIWIFCPIEHGDLPACYISLPEGTNFQKRHTWNAKCPICLGNFTPKTSNYCLKKWGTWLSWQIFVPVCPEETDPWLWGFFRNTWRKTPMLMISLTIPNTECMACLPPGN